MTENKNKTIKELRYIHKRCDNEGRYSECDALENAICAIEENQQYHAIEKRLADMFGGELPLAKYVDELEFALKESDSPHPMNAKILTYEDAAEWDKYLMAKKELEEKSGKSLDVVKLLHYFLETVFAGEKHEKFCILTNEDAKRWETYQTFDATVEELQALKEKAEPKKPITYEQTNRADCPVCRAMVRGIDKPFGDWCSKCGQKLDWD
jgi:hypothetical protein|nr:MAG TPA: zinc-ribbon containing domain protein [Caudoviricetes sp.]